MNLAARLTSALALCLVALSGTTPATASPAASPRPSSIAATGYTYWGFYSWDGDKDTWGYMNVGANDPATAKSQDGDVYGFRWALVVKAPRLPRAAADFDEICASTPQAAGKKRIGFVVDYGASRDAAGGDPTPAPEGLCASVDPDATAQQALLSVTDVRLGSSGLICGISAYPSNGCGETVQDAEEPAPDQPVQLVVAGSTPPTTADPSSGQSASPSSPPSSSPDDSASSADDGNSHSTLILVVAVAVIALLAAGALVVRRRNA